MRETRADLFAARLRALKCGTGRWMQTPPHPQATSALMLRGSGATWSVGAVCVYGGGEDMGVGVVSVCVIVNCAHAPVTSP